MFGIIVTGGLVGGALSGAEETGSVVRSYDKSCRQLANLAAYGWVDVERASRIRCLGSDAIPAAALDGLIRDFLMDCSDVVVRKVAARSDSATKPSARLSRDEVTRLFLRRYEPLFRRYCADANPGRGLVARPDSPNEV